MIFIFLIGIFSCEQLGIEEDPDNSIESNFDIFWNEFDRHYPFFIIKDVDWDSVYSLHRPDISQNTSSFELFDILRSIVISLEDGHVDLYTPFEDAGFDFKAGFPLNSPINVNNYVDRLTQLNRILYIGNLEDSNLGYIYISSFGGEEEEYEKIDKIIKTFGEKDGIVLDVRSNGGGSDINSEVVASRFADKKRAYMKARYRNGPDHNDFTSWTSNFIEPDGKRFNKKVVVLTNRGVFSSAESFTLAMRSIPNVTIVGDTTGGGSGNPILRELPNGWTFRLSTWMVATPDDEIFEGVGIPPDIPVWISEQDSIAGIDPILEAAIEELSN